MTTPGIDPGTVRLVTQRLNHYATQGPRSQECMFYENILIRKYIFIKHTFLRTGALGGVVVKALRY